ncbi:DNA/RNA-binding protein Alba [Candidatus Nitrososphaera gargensis Ga9.2]|uniref:DNA/RNA-binding protein Alba n=1 Tax=Nitrososphaera gargensis (strain Ga9.2) TaxID=1237085 RepID=K0ICR4_NITGG|nr:DNA/RNA-binding protein AlbA [Candidatus Nitrososphaera gargensis]AFU57435.1 DNA/RNA-binding protein Alba [Candidatus Nitrososphaera gargensis Ga9.2]
MMTAIVEQKTSLEPRLHVPPAVLLIGKKRTLDYVAPALYRINSTGELIIKAIGSLSIVTAVDVAEIVKRDVDVLTKSITVGTDELRIATGEIKRMSCIEIHLIKNNPIAVVPPAIDVHAPVEEAAAPVEISIEAAPDVAATVEVPVVVAEEKAKKPRAKRSSTTAKKKSSKKKKNSVSV